MQRTELFQNREHLDIIFAMEIMGYQGLDKQGMCFGFSTTALEFYNLGRLAEYDEVIQILSNLIQQTHQFYVENVFSIEAFGNHLKALIMSKEKELSEQNKLTISEIFTKVKKYHAMQENLEMDNCIILPSIVGIYDINDLHLYLSSLQNIINTNVSQAPGIAFLMASPIHADMLCIEPQNEMGDNEMIIFRDINYINNKNLLIHSGDDLNFLKTSLDLIHPDTEKVLSKTHIIIPKNNENILNCIKIWQDSEEYKQIHELSIERITASTLDDSSLLLDAAKSGNLSLIKQMFDICPNLPEYDFFPKALCFSIIFDQHAVVEYFLQKEIFTLDAIVKSHGHKFTPLQCSLIFNNFNAAKIILEKNVDVNIPFDLEITHLIDVAASNNVENLKNLFREKLLDFENPEFIIQDLTPLHLAALLGQGEIVDMLLKKDCMLSLSICSPDELAEAMRYHEIAGAIREKYQFQLNQNLDLLIQQSLSESAVLAIKYLQNNIMLTPKISLMKNFNDYLLFYEICQLEQSAYFENHYFQHKVSDLYNALILNKNSDEIKEEITFLLQKEQLLTERKEQMDSISNLLSDNKLSAFKHFESFVFSEAKLKDCNAMSQTLKILLNIDAVIENAKKPSRFLVQKLLHQDWAVLLDKLYTYFINKMDFDYSSIQPKLNKLYELISQTPNVLYDTFEKVPQKYKADLTALMAEINSVKTQKLSK